MHPRNIHRHGYQFDLLIKSLPELKTHIIKATSKRDSIDFSNSESVKCLNKALLKHHYGINYWDIPSRFLCPPVPGRADYIHAIADLLKQDSKNHSLKNIQALDIGTGANLIYPILGEKIYGWTFIASDINPSAVENAQKIAKKNSMNVQIHLQQDKNQFFNGVIESNQVIHVSVCNPPFHDSPQSAANATKLKWQKLRKKPSSQLNFSGHSPELWCDGGELRFLKNMISESQHYANQCTWFTSLVSKKDNLRPLKKALNKVGVKDYKIVKMSQGQKISRFIAWSFLHDEDRKALYNSIV